MLPIVEVWGVWPGKKSKILEDICYLSDIGYLWNPNGNSGYGQFYSTIIQRKSTDKDGFKMYHQL